LFDVVKKKYNSLKSQSLNSRLFSVSYEKLQLEQPHWLASPASAMGARFEVLIAVLLKIPVFWNVMLCRGASGSRRFEAP
jgi:hypothetical protein